ncbi:hypothetical protein DAMA08_001460 [Martiniozyma asiatica (nom. inval.)]|nr:hypothetical protein DAMA08_001460 [Martiniozyma asiatica]
MFEWLIALLFGQRRSLGNVPGGGTNANANANASLNIPNYSSGSNEDSIDLQLKSLLYVYHRFEIHSLKPFLKYNENTDQFELDHHRLHHQQQHFHQVIPTATDNTKKILINSKLDKIYNIERFKEALVTDPYRILIDYPKNKFRSMLILSGHPSNNMSIPNLTIPNFQFLILEPGASLEEYIDVLVYKSGIYAEHKISNKVKVQLLLRILTRQEREKGVGALFDNDDRANIIRLYLQKLAFYIQVDRLYRASLKAKEREVKNSLLRYTNDSNIASYKTLKSQRSRIMRPQTILDSSPTSKGSFLQDDGLDYPYYSDTTESQASSSASSTNFVKFFTLEEKSVFREQSKMAVRIRIERERNMLLY